MRKVPSLKLYDYTISKLSMDDTVALLCQWAESGVPHHTVTINPIMVMDALQKPDHHRTLLEADLLVPDGTGIVWAASYLKQPVTERVPGFDLLHRLLAVADQKQWRVFLLGTTEETIQTATDKLRVRFPGATFYAHHGFFGSEQDEQVITAVRTANPHLLFVARSADLQDPWIHKYKHALQVPVMMGVGGCFDIIAGKLKRAPLIWQRLRLEWLYRLLQEPFRYKRMLVLPKFVLKVIRDRNNGKLGAS